MRLRFSVSKVWLPWQTLETVLPMFCLRAQNRLTSYQNHHIPQRNMIMDSREACSFCQWYCSRPTVYLSTSSTSACGKVCHFYSSLNSKRWISANTLPTLIRMFLFTQFRSVHRQYLLIKTVTFCISRRSALWIWKLADCCSSIPFPFCWEVRHY